MDKVKDKMTIVTNPLDWHGVMSEMVWVEKTKENKYIVCNIPLYAYGISLGDVVEAEAEPEKGLQFVKVVERRGHSNYRVLMRKGFAASDFEERWIYLERVGCSYESSKDPEDVFAIDVPPAADVTAVYEYLRSFADEGVWYLDEGNFEHSLD